MNLFHKKASDNKGFTLIEVIAVLIILGIIAAVAVSRGMSTQNDLIPQADIVKSHLRFAQLKALQDDTAPWGINFGGSSPYTLYRNYAEAAINLPGESNRSHSVPAGSGITITGSPVMINFDRWGNPIGSSGNSLTNATVTLSLSQGGVTPIVISIAADTGYITQSP
jgi:prepilin-type N-terminal cleavage/methylation domain-containing protein